VLEGCEVYVGNALEGFTRLDRNTGCDSDLEKYILLRLNWLTLCLTPLSAQNFVSAKQRFLNCLQGIGKNLQSRNRGK
jgi:hypothetical protein